MGDNSQETKIARDLLLARARDRAEIARDMVRLQTYSPKRHAPGEQSYVSPEEAVKTLGLLANHRRLATDLVYRMIEGMPALQAVKEAKAAGIERHAVRELMRRTHRLIDEHRNLGRPVLSPRHNGPVTKAFNPLDLVKAEKAPNGFVDFGSKVPGGKRKMEGSGYVYWYPGSGVQGHPHDDEHDEHHQAHQKHLEQKLSEARAKGKPSPEVHAKFMEIHEKARAAGLRISGAHPTAAHTMEHMEAFERRLDAAIKEKSSAPPTGEQSEGSPEGDNQDELAGLSPKEQVERIAQHSKELGSMIKDLKKSGVNVAGMEAAHKALTDSVKGIGNEVPRPSDLQTVKLLIYALRSMILGALFGLLAGGGPGGIAGLAAGSVKARMDQKRIMAAHSEAMRRYNLQERGKAEAAEAAKQAKTEEVETDESGDAQVPAPGEPPPTERPDFGDKLARRKEEKKTKKTKKSLFIDLRTGLPVFAKAFTVEDVHEAADAAGVAWDDNQAFMDKCEKLTGKRHLDSMNANELRIVAENIGKSEDPAVSAKIKILMDEGYPQKQAVAIALDMQRRGTLHKGPAHDCAKEHPDQSHEEWEAEQATIEKGARHKYIKRVATGDPKRPWKYVYKVQHAGGVFNTDHMEVGSKFAAAGGHFHVAAKRGDRLLIRHDETGETKSVTREELHKLLVREHAAAIVAHKDRMRERLSKYKPGSYWHKRVQKQLAVWDKLPIEQQEHGWRDPKDVTTSQEFKAWFGDWQSGQGSKVVDSVGAPEEQFGQKPVKLFHGTPVGGFRSFSKDKDKGMNIFGRGFYFTADHGIATEYTEKDADQAIYSATGWVGKDGKPITTLTRAQMLEVIKTSGFSPNEDAGKNGWTFALDPAEKYAAMNRAHPELKPHGNHDPNTIYAAAKASDNQGNVDVATFLKFFWAPAAEDLERHKGNYEGIRVHDGSSGVSHTWMYRGLQKVMEEQGATPVIPDSQVFEVYLNVRNPVDMEAAVPKEQFDSLARATIRKGIERSEAAIARYEKSLRQEQAALDAYEWKDQWAFEGVKEDDRGKAPEGKVIVYPGGARRVVDPKDIPAMIAEDKANDREYLQRKISDFAGYIDREKQDLADHKKELDSKNPKITGMYLKSLLDFDDDLDAGRGYDEFLSIKKRLRPNRKVEYVDNQRVRTNEPAHGILHLTDENTLSWGDLHWIMSNGHSDPHIRGTFTDWAQEQGYDGIKHTGGWNIGTKAHDVWIAFEPNQIKATNAESFDASTDDIYKATIAGLSLSKAGPFIGPRGGKWADAKHTIPWKEGGHPKAQQVNPKNPYLFDLDPFQLVHTETGKKKEKIDAMEATPTDVQTKPIVVTEIDGKHHVLDGHHRTMVARRKNRPVRAIVIPHAAVEKMRAAGIHQAEMFSEFIGLIRSGEYAYISKAGPFIGPRGGKWADAKHTIPWKEGSATKPRAKKPKAPPKPRTARASAAQKRKAPGSQLPADVQAKLKELGIGKLPEASIPVDHIHLRLDGDPHETAVIKWRDSKGRLQSGYTPEFHKRNAAKKWERTLAFLDDHPKIVRGIVAKLKRTKPGSVEHQGALVAAIIAKTGLRPGSTKMLEGHYGAGTLLSSHVKIDGSKIEIEFVGKQGKVNTATIRSKEIATALGHYKRGGNLRNRPMFDTRAISAARAALPTGLKLKDLRTLIATKEAMRVLDNVLKPPPLTGDRDTDLRLLARAMLDASQHVAKVINNSAAVARTSYVHPEVFKKWAIDKAGADPALWEGAKK